MDKHLVKRLVVLALFLTVLFGGIFGWRAFVTAKIQQAMAQSATRRITVSATPVKRIDWPSELQATASLEAVQGTMLTPQLAGMVTGIDFQSGTTVQKGKLLVQLNDTTQRAQLQHDMSAIHLAKMELAQQRTLFEHHNTSELALQQAETAYTQARAAVSADRATIAKLQVRAPFTGHLGVRRISLGQYVDTSTAVVDLQEWNPIYADFDIPQQQLSTLAPGQSVTLNVAGISGRIFTGKLTAIGARVESGTRNVDVQATFTNPDGILRPGMYGEVTVRSGRTRKVLTVPDSAITYNTYGQYVYVIARAKEGLVAKERNVRTGGSRSGLTVITRGLEAGERVVTAGQVKLHPGAAVAIAPASGSAVAPLGTPAAATDQ